MQSNSSAEKRTGLVALNIGITTTNAYTAGSTVTVGTLVDALKPRFLTPFIIWDSVLSIGYVDVDGSVHVRNGNAKDAGANLCWVRCTYMAKTI